MSEVAEELIRAIRQRCQSCRDRESEFSDHGTARPDRNPALCFQCYRAARERSGAQHLHQGPTNLPDLPEARSPGAKAQGACSSSAPLTSRQLQHRWRMLAHLRSRREA